MKVSLAASLMLIAFVAIRPVSAGGLTVNHLTGTFGTGNTWTAWSATLKEGKLDLLAGSTVTLQYMDSAGAVVGAPVTATVAAGSIVSVPPPPIPVGATALGSKVEIKADSALLGAPVTATLCTYNSNWWWGVTPKIKLDPIGLPGAGPQHWFVESVGARINGTDSVFGSRSLTVVDSGFDLAYTSAGGTLYNVLVSGNDSFMRLSDDTYLGFVDGSSFGTIDMSSGTSGVFNFTAIGLAGTWLYDSLTNYTSATGTTFSGFSTPAISAVPEIDPAGLGSTIALVTGGLALLERRRRKTLGIA